ncbi:MAG: hypothetical protein CSA65_09515 [Proteobacteria bacterium]|nr:MAG: hypothetical protein CSB49_01655 [Pseudomonadota bacterium]PIE17213.1 MAG: hypothetical protein CSA65_09515 [Pseudomonadota bacterium]
MTPSFRLDNVSSWRPPWLAKKSRGTSPNGTVLAMARVPFRAVLGGLIALSLLVIAGIVGVQLLWPAAYHPALVVAPPRLPRRHVAPRRACTPKEPCLAIVVDDVGRDVAALRELLRLPLPLSFSVLPHARHTGICVATLRAHRAELLLHVPMLPRDPGELTDEPLVLSPGRPIAGPLAASLAAVPGARAVNNHMGSAFTEDPVALGRFFRLLARRGLPFLDSRTTPRSQACAVAERWNVPCQTRDVFLDDPNDPATVRYRLTRAARRARRRGKAIAIGHPMPRTLAGLRRFAGTSDAKLVVRLSEMTNSLKRQSAEGETPGKGRSSHAERVSVKGR